VGQAFAEGAGRVLRQARIARGLTLREVGLRSEGAFSPTAVAGYERGERSITLERFCLLANLYGIPPDRLLAEIFGDTADVIVDLTPLEEPQIKPSSGP
jgi:transcriptional regulator with XRE-family HTH domain